MRVTPRQDFRRASYSDLVRDNTNFRFLWFGQIISLLGDWFNLIASATLVASLTESGVAVGGLFVVRMLAPFLVSPFAGVAADRYNRKHILILTDLGRAITLLGFLLVREPGQVWLLYLLTAIQLAMSGFFFPTRTSILPDIVSKGELGAANALSGATWSVMLAFGAAIGGIVAGRFGAHPAFAIDSLTYLASAVLISRIRYHHRPELDSPDKSIIKALRQYVDGLRYLWQHSDFLVIALQKAAYTLALGGAFQVVQVALANEEFEIGQGGGTSLGIMLGIMGIGTGLGPIIGRRFTGDRDRSLRIALAISYFMGALGMAMMAPLSSFAVVLIGNAVRGIGGGIIWVFSTQLLLQLVPDRVRGRVFATEFALFTLMTAVGAAAGGWALDNTKLGISGMLWFMALLTLIPGVLWVLWNLRRSRSQPLKSEGEPVEAAEKTVEPPVGI